MESEDEGCCRRFASRGSNRRHHRVHAVKRWARNTEKLSPPNHVGQACVSCRGEDKLHREERFKPDVAVFRLGVQHGIPAVDRILLAILQRSCC